MIPIPQGVEMREVKTRSDVKQDIDVYRADTSNMATLGFPDCPSEVKLQKVDPWVLAAARSLVTRPGGCKGYRLLGHMPERRSETRARQLLPGLAGQECALSLVGWSSVERQATSFPVCCPSDRWHLDMFPRLARACCAPVQPDVYLHVQITRFSCFSCSLVYLKTST